MTPTLLVAFFSFLLGFSIRMYYDFTEKTSNPGGLHEHICPLESGPNIDPHTGRMSHVWHDSQHSFDEPTARVWEM